MKPCWTPPGLYRDIAPVVATVGDVRRTLRRCAPDAWMSLQHLIEWYCIEVDIYPHHATSLERLKAFLWELVEGGEVMRCTSFETIGRGQRRVAGPQEFYTLSINVLGG